MQPEKPVLDHYNTQYYVITPRDRVRLAGLIAPLPARETEHLFKMILNDSFMANDMKKNGILDRIRFCAFRHALAIVRATPDGPSGWVNDPASVEKHQQRLEKYVGLIRDYDAAYAEALLPLQKKHIEPAKGSQVSTANLYRSLTSMFASQLARHKSGIQTKSPADLKALEDSLQECKTTLIKDCYRDQFRNTLPARASGLRHLKPW